MIWEILAMLSKEKAATATNNGSAVYQLCSPAALLQKGQLTLYMIFCEEQLSAFLLSLRFHVFPWVADC